MKVNEIRYQPKKVQSTVACFGALHAFDNVLVLVELALFNRDIDADDILPDNPACTDVQMTGNYDASR